MRSLLVAGCLVLSFGCSASRDIDDAPLAAAALAVREAQLRLQVTELKAGKSPDGSDPRTAPPGYVTVKVETANGPEFGDAVLLYSDTEKRVMPIYIGGTEALSIQLRVQQQRFQRPLTHDLFDDAVAKLGGKVVRVQVDSLRDSVYIGSVVLERDGLIHTLDARPSDAIALALGSGAPIYVSSELLRDAGMRLEDLEMAAPRKVEPVAL
jgi:hypothetical protein